LIQIKAQHRVECLLRISNSLHAGDEDAKLRYTGILRDDYSVDVDKHSERRRHVQKQVYQSVDQRLRRQWKVHIFEAYIHGSEYD
jgi:hypothetical protein